MAEKNKLIYLIDIDGTICTQCNDYNLAKPYKDRIALINALYDTGITIKFFTSRGATTGIDWREVTEKQLKDWGVKYHELIMGKPDYHVFIDDKCINSKDFFTE